MRRHHIGHRFGLAALLIAQIARPAAAQDFALQVGPPVAGNGQGAKSSLLVVRPSGCVNPATVQITATAEGIVDGARRSIPLRLTPMPTPGVHAIAKEWPNGGVWIMSLAGTCAGKTAGVIVSLGESGEYHRDAVKHLAHAATASEIDASLRTLAPGSRR
jgi:hypothetical protein